VHLLVCTMAIAPPKTEFSPMLMVWDAAGRRASGHAHSKMSDVSFLPHHCLNFSAAILKGHGLWGSD